MSPRKIPIHLSILLLFVSSCTSVDLPRFRLTDTRIPLPTRTPTPTATRTPTPTPLPPTTTPVPIPAWVSGFADPLLAEMEDHPPDFQDNFTQLNQGWFYFGSGSRTGPFYAHLQDGALLLKLPEGPERNDLMVFNPELIRTDFILSFDFKFWKTEPKDILRFQIEESAERRVSLDLSKSEDWSFSWSLRTDRQLNTGTYDYFSPERVNVVIIMQGTECAVLLNHDPLDYLRDCRNRPVIRSSPTAVSFHLLSIPGRAAELTIDNVKLWDLGAR
jgi:hypothetical protein